MLRRILLTLAAVAALLLGGIATAGNATARPASADAVVFTVDNNLAPPYATADDIATTAWAKATVVGFTEGECSGPLCITVDDNLAACGAGLPLNVIGCAEPLADGTCAVHVAVPTDYGTGELSWSPEQLAQVIEHEIGHCLGLGHSTDRRSIMYPSTDVNGGQRITQANRAAVNAIFS